LIGSLLLFGGEGGAIDWLLLEFVECCRTREIVKILKYEPHIEEETG